MSSGSNPYASPASETDHAAEQRTAGRWQLRVLHAGLALVYVGMMLVLLGFILNIVGRVVLRDVLMAIAGMSILLSGFAWTGGQLLCLAAPARFGARWLNGAFLLVQFAIAGLLSLEVPLDTAYRNFATIVVWMVCLGMFTLFLLFLRQLALSFGQAKFARRASVLLMAGAVTVAASGGYFAIRGAGFDLLPVVGPITLLITSLILFTAVAKLVRNLRLTVRDAYQSQRLSEALTQVTPNVSELAPSTTAARDWTPA